MEETKKVLYGGESTNVCAYCKRKGCYMTVKQLKKKECLRKNCHHLDKKEDHEWWKQRELLKQKKHQNKMLATA